MNKSATKDLRVAIIVGSTRPGRNGAAVAAWVAGLAAGHGGAAYEIVDLAEYPLPHLDEALPPMAASYSQSHTIRWAEVIGGFDAFVFVTPEYNHSIPGVLKNSIDFLFAEWNDKAAALVSYGVEGGHRAAEHLRTILGELKIADIRNQVGLSFSTDFEGYTTFAPAAHRVEEVDQMLDELVGWAGALQRLRHERLAATGVDAGRS
jgi:NAD(P)H-dependent FMN reductase